MTNIVICFQYRIGQLYMIAKHSLEQSEKGEGVEVVKNEPCEDPKHGKGQLTEKRIYLSRYVQITRQIMTYSHPSSSYRLFSIIDKMCSCYNDGMNKSE